MRRNFQSVGNKLSVTPDRRQFLKIAGVGMIGLSLPELSFANIAATKRLLVYVGTYTNGKSEGIYLYHLDLASGELTHFSTTKGIIDPSFLALTPNRRFLYAVNEVEEFEGKKSGAVSAFAIDQRTGELRFLNQQASLGGSPCYVDIDLKGRFVLIANYAGGNVTVFPVRPDGSLGTATDLEQDEGSSIDKQRQEGPHAHCIVLDPPNTFAYSCDLGTDKIMIYRFDAQSGKLVPNNQPWVRVKPGAGPRHLAFHPGGRYIFILNELNSTVTAFARDLKTGSLNELQTLTTLPSDFTGTNSSADIHVSPDGRFLYCSNRGHDSIAAFTIDSRAGSLTSIGHEPTGGTTPRNFAIDPSGTFLLVANQKSDNIVVFKLDQKTGRLNKTANAVEVPSPVCLKLTRRFS
jgi:6-phosphogluconolactonase